MNEIIKKTEEYLAWLKTLKDDQHLLNDGWIHQFDDREYRRKQTKQLVDWSCPLLKGASTNFGELFQHSKGTTAWLYGNGMWIGSRELRLAHTHVTPSNWQAYNGEDLIALHEAGFVVEVRYWEAHSEKYVHVPLEHYLSTPVKYLAAYRVIAIRDGFTDNPAEVV